MTTLFLVALIAFSRSVKSAVDLGNTSHESAIAREAIRRILESMSAVSFDEAFALYNSDPSDDLDGPGTADGSSFSVGGLQPLSDDADGMVGEIVLPEDQLVFALREDIIDARIGMPRDLDLDGVIDGEDHSGNYRVLPVYVRIEWRGPTGPRELMARTILGDR